MKALNSSELPRFHVQRSGSCAALGRSGKQDDVILDVREKCLATYSSTRAMDRNFYLSVVLQMIDDSQIERIIKTNSRSDTRVHSLKTIGKKNAEAS